MTDSNHPSHFRTCAGCNTSIGQGEPCRCDDVARVDTIEWRNVSDPVAFWASVTPAQALALLKAAPKVAGPWEHRESDFARRHGVSVDARPIALASAYSWDTRGTSSNGKDQGGLALNDEDVAKDDADAALVAAEWVLA